MTSWYQDGWETTTSDNTNNPILTSESKEELKNLLMRVKEESEKASLELNIKKTKIMASGSHCFMSNRWGQCGRSGRFPIYRL